MSIRTTDPLDALGLSDTDRRHMTSRGWLPKTAFPELEELRERHEALITQREAKQAGVMALRRRFEAEDEARQRLLDVAYRLGAATPENAPDERTSPEERKAALEDAEAHAIAAANAVVSFCRDTFLRLRGCETLPADWNPWLRAQSLQVPAPALGAELLAQIAGEESQLRAHVNEAQRVIERANERLREYHPLKQWIAKTANGGNGQIDPGYDLPLPVTHTAMSKPRDLEVPGWWQDDQIGDDTLVVPEGQEDLIPEDAESGVVEQSDPEVLARFDKERS